MSNIDGLLVADAIERQQIFERASVEPYLLESEEDSPHETDSLLDVPRTKIPKRIPIFLAVTFLFELCSISTSASSLDLYYNYVCGHYGIDQELCLSNEMASKTVARFVGVSSSLEAVFSLVVTSVLTIASDMLGRKPMIIMAMGANCLSVVAAWYIFFHMSRERTYWVMLVPAIIDGLGGSTNLIQLLRVPYITDMINDAKERTRLMAIFSGCTLASLAAGPMTASWIIKYHGLQPLYLSAITGLATSTVLAAVFVRESLSPVHRRRNSEAGPGVNRVARIITFDHVQNRQDRRNARILLLCALLVMGYGSCFYSVLILYPKLRFGWAAVKSGYLLSAMFGTRTFCILVGFPFLYKLLSKVYTVHSNRVDKVDRTLLVLSSVIAVLGSLALGWSRNGKEYFMSGIFDSSTALGSPVLLPALSKHVPGPQMGSFMAAFNVVLSVLVIFVPSLVMQLYSVTLQWRPSITFELTASVFAIVLALSFTLRLD